jgi:hypothetical protein
MEELLEVSKESAKIINRIGEMKEHTLPAEEEKINTTVIENLNIEGKELILRLHALLTYREGR